MRVFQPRKKPVEAVSRHGSRAQSSSHPPAGLCGSHLPGCRFVLCLPARQSRLGLHKRSCVTSRDYLQVASMAQRQPDVVNVRNGPSRGRSRSISRSRSRSRSPSAARESPDKPSLWLAAPAAPLNPAPWGELAPASSPFGAAPSMSSLARSGTVDRGRAQRARYLGDEDEPRTGRSRSCSVSRFRSRSRSPSPGVRPLQYAPKHWFPNIQK